MNNALRTIIAREYLERVKRKSFIITTLLMPVIMIALMVIPGLIAVFSGTEKQTIAVIDDTEIIAPILQNTDDIVFRPVTGELAEFKTNEDYTAILTIDRNAIAQPRNAIKLYTHGAIPMQTEMLITGQLESAIRDHRIEGYDIPNLNQILDDIDVDIDINTHDLDKDDDSSSTSSMLSYMLSMLTSLTLYMVIMIYGQMVMTSIIEEKSNRVLELVVSSVKPFDLMMGKILGVGAVAVTQLAIWGALITACSAWLMPMLASAASTEDAFILDALSQLSNAGYIANIFIVMIFALIGGYLFYSAIYAAIGSAVDNIQDASQISIIAVAPLIIAMMVSMAVCQNPSSTLALWTTFIPFTSPMIIMSRIVYGMPLWQEIVSIVVLYISFVGMIWLSAKIYRVGIFMYGKKPTIKELIRWTRYK